MNLAAKYRPKDFSDVVGQDIVATILEKICLTEPLTIRNFLLIGPAGCGKTSQARIIAHKLNGPEYEPLEIDAASHGGVDDIRQLVADARSYPIGFRYKVIIIDECHALSSAAWQSLLKVLEENPAATIMCLCTTNPEKIPATILSRVQTFRLSKISLDNIYNRLLHIIDCENQERASESKPLITYELDAVNYIAKSAQGGMRDAITLLDKVLACSDAVTSQTVETALGLPDYEDYFLLLNAVAKKNNEIIIQTIHRVYNSGVNFVRWFDGFLSFISNIVKYIYLQDINATMIPSHYKDKISGYSTAHAALCLKLANKLVKLNHELRTTQYLQELAITYLCTPPTKEVKQNVS